MSIVRGRKFDKVTEIFFHISIRIRIIGLSQKFHDK